MSNPRPYPKPYPTPQDHPTQGPTLTPPTTPPKELTSYHQHENLARHHLDLAAKNRDLGKDTIATHELNTARIHALLAQAAATAALTTSQLPSTP